jgi:acetoin utilization deacetylase AcuC-like enzyme
MARLSTVCRAVAAPVLLSHPASLEHDTEPHPEQPARMRAIDAELERRGGLGWERRDSPEATWEQLTRVHPPRYLRGLEELCLAGGGALDPDTVVSPGSWAAALRGAGGAVAAVDLVLDGAVPTAMSVHRPPGHHAEPARAMGFCLLSNAAIAARHALARGLERVLVLDWDVHHGNGTQAVFEASPEVLVVSIHEYPLYPGTGAAGERGTGAGGGFTVNLPVPGGSGDAVWASLVEHVAVPRARAFAPELVLVSAGFDAHVEDPLSTCRMTDEGFATLAGSIRRLAAELEVPFAAVLEGGYALGALGRSVAATLAVLGAPAPPPVPTALARHPLAVQAAERLGTVAP